MRFRKNDSITVIRKLGKICKLIKNGFSDYEFKETNNNDGNILVSFEAEIPANQAHKYDGSMKPREKKSNPLDPWAEEWDEDK